VSLGLGEVLGVDLTYELRARLRNDRNLRIPAEDRSRHANRAFGFATADVGVGERTLPT
jgi:hypothetical protein